MQITKNGGCNQMESADGAYVYYLKSGDRELWRVPTAGGQEAALLALTHRTQFALGTRGAYLLDTIAPATLKYLISRQLAREFLVCFQARFFVIVDSLFRPMSIGYLWEEQGRGCGQPVDARGWIPVRNRAEVLKQLALIEIP